MHSAHILQGLWAPFRSAQKVELHIARKFSLLLPDDLLSDPKMLPTSVDLTLGARLPFWLAGKYHDP